MQGANKLDWEVELCFVICHLPSQESLDSCYQMAGVIAVYVLVSSVSERAVRLEYGGQKRKAGAVETFNPAGHGGTPDDLGFIVFDQLTVAPLEGRFMVLETDNLINTGAPP